MSIPVMLEDHEKDLAVLVAQLPTTANTAWRICWHDNGWRLELHGVNTGRCFKACTVFSGTRSALYYQMKGYLEHRISAERVA